MARLDRERPYGEVWGGGLQGYEQDGRLFRVDGSPVDEPDYDPVPVADWAIEAAPVVVVKPARGRAGKAAAAGAVEAAPAAEPEKSEIDDLPDDELKVLVDVSGGTWTDRKAALAFLSAK